MPNGVQSILHFAEYSRSTQEQREHTDQGADHTVRGLVRRLNQVLNGFRAVSAYESLDLSSNLTLRGLYSKNQAGYCNRDN